MSLGLRPELLLGIGAGLLLAALLRALRPVDRRSIAGSALLLLTCVVAELASALAAREALPRIASVTHHAATLVTGVAMIRLLMLAFFRLLLPAAGVRVVRIAEDLCGAGVIVVWGLLWLGLAGVNLASLITTSAVLTGVVAFAMQDTLGNILGGIVLQLDGSMRVGDWVDIDGVRGRVSDVR